MAQHSPPEGYEEKYASFITMIRDVKQAGNVTVLVDQPWVLGDNYEEIIESLSRLAEAGLTLQIARRAE